ELLDGQVSCHGYCAETTRHSICTMLQWRPREQTDEEVLYAKDAFVAGFGCDDCRLRGGVVGRCPEVVAGWLLLRVPNLQLPDVRLPEQRLRLSELQLLLRPGFRLLLLCPRVLFRPNLLLHVPELLAGLPLVALEQLVLGSAPAAEFFKTLR